MRLRYIFFTLVAAAAGYTAYWYSVANSADAEIRAMLRVLSTNGVEIEYGEVNISGFPYRFVFDFEEASLRAREGPIEINWYSINLQIITQPWTQNHLIFFAPTSSGIISRDGSGTLDIQTDTISASFNRTSAEIRISVEFQDLIANEAGSADILFTAENMALHLRYPRGELDSVPSDSLRGAKIADFAIGARNIRLRGGAGDAAITELSAATTLRGSSIPRLDPEALGRWRDSGGTLEIDPLNMTLPGLDLSADGSFSVDAGFRPLGALSTRLEGPDQAGDALEAIGLINPASKSELATALTLLAAFTGDDGVPLSLTVQDGRVWLGPIEIGRARALVNSEADAAANPE